MVIYNYVNIVEEIDLRVSGLSPPGNIEYLSLYLNLNLDLDYIILDYIIIYISTHQLILILSQML